VPFCGATRLRREIGLSSAKARYNVGQIPKMGNAAAQLSAC